MPCFRLETARLLLRPPEPGDVKAITAFMEWDDVKNLSRAPHPYLEEHAHAFLGRQEEGRAKGADFASSPSRARAMALSAGMCGVHLREKGFELGYCSAVPIGGRAMPPRAAAEVLAFAFRNLRADAVEAGWFHDNPASGRVLEKVGSGPTAPAGAIARPAARASYAIS